ncbi:MAG: sigma-70 family RNA polymerase sigma factor [Ruthenibacterium sp.]
MTQEETATLTALYEQYYPKIYNYFFYTLLNHDVAYDLTSQTFLKVITKIDSYHADKAKLSTWLFAVAKNTLIDNYRKKKLQVTSLDNLAESGIELKQVEERTVDDDDAFLSLIQTLSEKEREIIICRFYFDMTYAEIAQNCHLTPTNVSVIISRCIKKLRKVVSYE